MLRLSERQRNFAERDGAKHAVDAVTGFRERQQHGAIEDRCLVVDCRAAEADRAAGHRDARNVTGHQLEQAALQALGNALAVEGRPGRVAQRNADIREARAQGHLIDVDHQAIRPVEAEIGRVDLRTPGQAGAREFLPNGVDTRCQTAFVGARGHIGIQWSGRSICGNVA
jgi:hypothetical protein